MGVNNVDGCEHCFVRQVMMNIKQHSNIRQVKVNGCENVNGCEHCCLKIGDDKHEATEHLKTRQS